MRPLSALGPRRAAAALLLCGPLVTGCLGVRTTVSGPDGPPEPIVATPAATVLAAAGSATDAGAGPGAPTVADAALDERAYRLGEREIVLVGGAYTEPAGPDSATAIVKVARGEWTARGDLDGDGAEDVALTLVDAPGGSGVFTYLAVVASTADPDPAVAAPTLLLGDRVRIERVSVAGGRVEVTGVEHGPDDPLCCPTRPFTRAYVLAGGALEPVP